MKNRIREVLQERGITQKELAEGVGMSEIGLSKALDGSATKATVEKIAKWLNVDPETLIDERVTGVKVKYKGELQLGEFPIPCYVLEDGRRVLSGRGIQESLKMVDEGKKTSGHRIHRYLTQKTLMPFIFKDKTPGHFEPIICYSGDKKINGYEASIFIEICDGFLEARKYIDLSPRQAIIATQCEILVRSFAKVGLIALIDEATGYNKEKTRAKDELQKYLSSFLREEAARWVKTFPDSFFEDMYKMRNWTWQNTSKRPGVVGRIIGDIVYDRIGPCIHAELDRLNPKNERGYRSSKHHQYLTEVGKVKLGEHLATLHGLAIVSDYRWEKFMAYVDKTFPKQYQQLSLFDIDDIE